MNRDVFIDAFRDQPSFKYMFPNPETRPRHVGTIFDLKVESLGTYLETYTTPGPVKGFASWLAPDNKPKINVLQRLRAGYWKTPFIVGLGNFARALEFGAHESKILKPYLDGDYWILDVIAVASTHQGSGVGGKLMEPVFVKSSETGIPCVVLTHNPANVPFYRKYGFELVRDEPVTRRSELRSYVLERSPLL